MIQRVEPLATRRRGRSRVHSIRTTNAPASATRWSCGAFAAAALLLPSLCAAQAAGPAPRLGTAEVARLFGSRQEVYLGTLLEKHVADYQPAGGCGRRRLPLIHSVWTMKVRVDSVVKASAFRAGQEVVIRSLDEPIEGAGSRVFGYASQSCSDADRHWGGVLPLLADGAIQIDAALLGSGMGDADGPERSGIRLSSTSLVSAVDALVRDRLREDLHGRTGVGLFRVKETVSALEWLRGRRTVKCAAEYSVLGAPIPAEIEVTFVSDCATHLEAGTQLLLPWGKPGKPLKLSVCPSDYVVQADAFVPALRVSLRDVDQVLALSQPGGTTILRR